MNIALTDDLQRLLGQRVENGQFPNEEAVIKEALKRFLIDELIPDSSREHSGTDAPTERLPGPFLEDEATVAPLDLPRSGQKISCSYPRNAPRLPDLFPGD
jgi:Arc/MetJ-type ribon-helix-helix transcriptional regulator